MQLLNVYGCKGYLENVASNHIFQQSYIVTIKAPFESPLIQFKDKDPSTLIFICTRVRELVYDGTITLLYCASSEQVADIFTKVFYEKTFSNLKSLLGISDHAVQA